MILNNVILFKYCTEMTKTLPDGHLGVSPGPYSQSYPQNLWVRIFLFCSNKLIANTENLSSIDQQAFELA